ncbi:PREDICTED: uncharacterized protein LOC109155929 isoform X2 [Ipomoea nil]|nr:PREDICTED: uncharacterized protein LOC109155929 isoform X2 [Ipomoea nil]
MSLRNLMEDKRLNLNQPLLSVRRNSSIVGKDDMTRSQNDLFGRKRSVPQPPCYKSELKSGPVSNPGVVPFFWEQIPGKPKDEVKPEADHTRERPVPKLPPGRTSVANQRSSDNGPGSFNSSKAVVEDNDDNYESADEEDVFLDALDTLSRTQSSVFLNCSVSGLDEPEGRPSTDPQTREFMINRFLPAAKAMASETVSEIPQYAPKKMQAFQEQPRQLNKVVKPDRQPQKLYAHSSARHYYQPRDYEEESDDDDYSHEDIPVKACGLLPSFCFRGSFGFLNPVPGMSVRTRVPKPPGSRMQARSSYAGLCSGVETDESEKKLTFKSNNNQRPEESSLYKLQNSDVSDNHNKPPETNVSIDALGLPKKACKSFQELIAAEDSLVQQDSDNCVAEKTVYVDTVHKLESPVPKSSSPEAKGTIEILVTTVKKHMVDHFQDDAEKLTSVDEEAKTMPIVQETSNFNSLSAADELNSKPGGKPGNDDGQEQYYEETITSVKAANNDVDEGLLKQDRTAKPENPHEEGEFKEFPVPPPLPKSPSDSWLFRTLPSLSTKNSAFHPKQGTGNPRNQAPKWETIVKTTKWQGQHLRNSQELMPFRPIPEAL